jgi:DNA-binding transcriptional LysR family regulator
VDTLESVRVFIQVATLGSFVRASDHLDLSRGTVTRYVAVLEKRLGTRLLNRNTRSLSLTESGRLYLDRVKDIIDDLTEIERLVSGYAHTPSGTLKVLAPVAFGQHRLTPALSGFRVRYPEVLPDITLTDHDFELIERGYDVAIVPLSSINGVSIVARPLTQTPFKVCAAPGYLQRNGIPKHPNDLAHHCSLATSIDHDGTQGHTFIGPDGECKVALVPAIVAKDTEVLRQAALAEMGIGFLPVPLIADDLCQGRLVQLLPAYSLPDFTLQIVYPSKQFLPTKVRFFINYLLDYFAESPTTTGDISSTHLHMHNSSPTPT